MFAFALVVWARNFQPKIALVCHFLILLFFSIFRLMKLVFFSEMVRILAHGNDQAKQVLLKSVGNFQSSKGYKQRMARCKATFHSRAICTDSATFFVWARLAAKNVKKNYIQRVFYFNLFVFYRS